MNKQIKKYVDQMVVAPLSEDQKQALSQYGIKALGLYLVRTKCKNCDLRGVSVFQLGEKIYLNRLYCCKCAVASEVVIEKESNEIR